MGVRFLGKPGKKGGGGLNISAVGIATGFQLACFHKGDPGDTGEKEVESGGNEDEPASTRAVHAKEEVA